MSNTGCYHNNCQRCAFSSITIPSGVFDEKYNIVCANEPLHKMLGYQGEELIGLNIKEIIKTDNNYTRDDVLAERRLAERKDGNTCEVDILYLNNTCNTKYQSFIMFNFLEHDVILKKMNKYADEIKRSHEDVKQFAYIVSHDLRAPLVNIKGFACELEESSIELTKVAHETITTVIDSNIVKKVEKLSNDINEALTFIKSSVTRMDGLINAILKFSRLGHKELTYSKVDTKKIIKKLLQTMEHQIQSKSITVAIGNMPEIKTDRDAIEQIFGNLIDNAIKYLKTNTTGQIEIDSFEVENVVTFKITDNGKGIPEKDFEKVFQIFQRAGNNINIVGDGMGLSYVKTLIQRLGGEIWFVSKEDEGTTFYFCIPVYK